MNKNISRKKFKVFMGNNLTLEDWKYLKQKYKKYYSVLDYEGNLKCYINQDLERHIDEVFFIIPRSFIKENPEQQRKDIIMKYINQQIQEHTIRRI